MKVHPLLKTERAQNAFTAVLVILILIVLPALPLGKHGGGIAMLVASVIGLVLYFALFGQRLRSRHQLMLVALAAGLGAVLAAVLTQANQGP